MEQYTVVNNEAESQLQIDAGGLRAYLVYRFYKDDIAFMHTFVPKPLEGKGIGAALAKAAFAYAESLHKPVMVYCPYVSVFIQRHPEYKRFVDPQYQGG